MIDLTSIMIEHIGTDWDEEENHFRLSWVDQIEKEAMKQIFATLSDEVCLEQETRWWKSLGKFLSTLPLELVIMCNAPSAIIHRRPLSLHMHSDRH